MAKSSDKLFVVERQEPTVYSDKRGHAINGFLVTGTLVPWDETFEIRVPSLDPDVIKAKIMELVEQRRALEAMSS